MQSYGKSHKKVNIAFNFLMGFVIMAFIFIVSVIDGLCRQVSVGTQMEAYLASSVCSMPCSLWHT